MVTRCNPQVAVINRDPVAGSGTIKGGVGGAPVLMTGSETLSAGEKLVTVNMKMLQTLKQTPYYINEIRIAANIDLTGEATPELKHGIGAVIQAQFSTGRYGFSNDAMPIALYGARHSGGYDYGIAPAGVSAGGAPLNYTQEYKGYYSIRWLLPQPLYMLPGDVLQCRLSRTSDLLSALGDATVLIGYAGRIVAPGAPPPKLAQVPWVAWMQKFSNVATVESATTFRNPFIRPLHVQRFTVRNYNSDPFAANDTAYETYAGLFPGVTSPERIRLEDSLGYKIVGGAVNSSGNTTTGGDPAIGTVFDYPRRSWTFSREIGPREQFNMLLSNLSPTAGASRRLLQVGMIGYRDEEI